jgi:hypothetical protein
MKKDLILGCITNYTFDKVANWVNSIDRSGFDGHKLVIAYNVGFDIVDELTKRNIPLTNIDKEIIIKNELIQNLNEIIAVKKGELITKNVIIRDDEIEIKCHKNHTWKTKAVKIISG